MRRPESADDNGEIADSSPVHLLSLPDSPLLSSSALILFKRKKQNHPMFKWENSELEGTLRIKRHRLRAAFTAPNPVPRPSGCLLSLSHVFIDVCVRARVRCLLSVLEGKPSPSVSTWLAGSCQGSKSMLKGRLLND